MSTSTDEKKLLYLDDYPAHFNTESYLKEIYCDMNIHASDMFFPTFFFKNTIRILKDNQMRLENQKALKFGGGPILWPSFLLAQYVDSIRFCDYTQSNLDAVHDWIDRKDNAFDWTQVFEGILDANDTARDKLSEWQSRLRNALTQGGLSKCDVTNPNCPILSGQAGQYDIIFSSLCLEAACSTLELFEQTIQRLVHLLKSGGLLLLLMVRNESFYYVNQEKFFCLPLNETGVKQILNQTNELVDIHIESTGPIIEDKQGNTPCDCNGLMVIHAHKRIILANN